VDRRRVSTLLSTRLFNPLVKAATNAGLAVPGIAILETTGRKSGRLRRTPVGRSVDGDTCWIVVEHGRKAAYVRNIEADPRVRIKIGRRWRAGTAHVMPDDDPRARQRAMPAVTAAVVRLMGTDLLTVRIDLDRERRNEQARAQLAATGRARRPRRARTANAQGSKRARPTGVGGGGDLTVERASPDRRLVAQADAQERSRSSRSSLWGIPEAHRARDGGARV
jgi:deazaflavin-dependent oxidoreductase (nitroreductase family)